jgi:LPXTG-site transpeptidase (sortase) family protein
MMRRILVFGTVGTVVLIACIAAVMLVSLSGWFMLDEGAELHPIRVSPVAPLNIEAVSDQKVVESPPGLIPAALEERAVTPTLPTATATASPTPVSASSVSPGLVPTPGPAVTRPGVATRLVVPKLNLDRAVLFSPIEQGTWQVGHLEQAVGHLEGTARPGARGNLVLAGHVSLLTGAPGPFADLDRLAPGDLIIVYEGNKEFYYVVDAFYTVDQMSVEVAYPTETGQITLITCTNWNEAQGRYIDRFVVKGHLIEL